MTTFIVDDEGVRVNVDRIDFYRESYDGVFARVGNNNHDFDMPLAEFETFLAGIVTVHHLPEATPQDAPVQDNVLKLGDQVRITEVGSLRYGYVGELVSMGMGGHYGVRLNVSKNKVVVTSVERY